LKVALPKDNNLCMLMILNQIQNTLPAGFPKVLRLALSFFYCRPTQTTYPLSKFNTLLFADETTLTLSNGSVHELERNLSTVR